MSAAASKRIPFETAIADPLLLANRFEELSTFQRMALKVMYGAPLAREPRAGERWSELDLFWAAQGHGEYDELGFLERVSPPEGAVYVPEEYQEAWLIMGVRSGKSDAIAATIVCYEAVCGGHEAFFRRGKRAVCFQIAQDLAQAQYALHGIRATLESIPLLTKINGIKAVTAKRIDLWNGITIATTPPTVKSVRGYDSPVAVLDEVGVWYQEADSANPDFEIYRQVNSRQAQFAHPKIVGISSPWNKAGMLFARWEAGTNGVKAACPSHRGAPRRDCEDCARERISHRSRLVLHTTTANSGNPLVQREWLTLYRNRDPKAFERECLARFQDSISGFLDASLLEKAVDRGVRERSPASGVTYVAAVDPAFRQDAFGFAIGHADAKRGVVIDVVRRWTARDAGGPLDPRLILAEIALICQRYKVSVLGTDQHEINSFTQLASDLGLTTQEFSLQGGNKANIFANLQGLLHQHRLRLLDDDVTNTELRMLEKRMNQGGTISITAPPGQHDDMAMVIALVAHQALWYMPDAEPEVKAPPTIQELCEAQIAARYVELSPWD